MDVKPGDGHDGLQVVHPTPVTRRSDDGMQHFPHSDKQVVQEEKTRVEQSRAAPKLDYYAESFPMPKEKYQVSDKELYLDGKSEGNLQPIVLNERRYFGLRPTIFWALLALICVLLIAAAVGGGVGGSMAARSEISPIPSSSTSSVMPTSATSVGTSSKASTTQSLTSSATSTRTYLSAAPTTTGTSNGVGEYNCPAENGTFYESSLYSQTFEVLCNADWPEGVAGINGGQVVDLNTGVVATSIQACIEQCSANYANGGECSAVAYGANISLALSRTGITGNCFMKTQRGATIYVDNSGQAMAAFRVAS